MAKKRTDLLWIEPVNLVVEDGFNVRYDYGDIDELAQSIIENGVKVPLRGVKNRGTDQYIITDGHRRFKAVQRAIELGATDLLVPLIPDKRGISEEKRVLGMVIYNDGKRLTLLEEALVYDRLISYGLTQAEIARKVGKSPTHISNCILLANAPTVVKNQIKEGNVSASFVIEELKKKSGVKVAEMVQETSKEVGGKVSRKHLKPKTKSIKVLYKELQDTAGIDRVRLRVLQALVSYQAGDMTEEKLIEFFKQ